MDLKRVGVGGVCRRVCKCKCSQPEVYLTNTHIPFTHALMLVAAAVSVTLQPPPHPPAALAAAQQSV